jgi:hypothetical protein
LAGGISQAAPALALARDPRPECGHPTKSGGLCKWRGKCWKHDPSLFPEARQAAVLKGAAAAARVLRDPKAPDPSLKTMSQIIAYIEQQDGKHERGELNDRGLAAKMRVADVALRAHSDNVSEKLDELERLAAARARAVGGRRR